MLWGLEYVWEMKASVLDFSGEWATPWGWRLENLGLDALRFFSSFR